MRNIYIRIYLLQLIGQIYLKFKMSSDMINLCGLIINEYYGPLCEKVGTYLLKKGPLQLRLLSDELDLKINQVCFNMN